MVATILLAAAGAILIGSRNAIVEMALLAGPVVYYLRPGLIAHWRIGLAGIAIAFLLVAIYGYWRDAQFAGGLSAYQTAYAKAGIPPVLQPFAQPYLYCRNTVVAFSEAVRLIPSTTPFQHGRLLMAGPMQFLPGHREGADIFFKRLLGLNFSGGAGVPASLLGIYYGDFGVPGIVAGMALIGFLLELFYIRFRGLRSLGSLLGYSFLLKVALWSLFVGPLPYTTTLTVPLLLGVSVGFVHTPQHRLRAGWPPTWALATAALMIVGGLVLVFKHRA